MNRHEHEPSQELSSSFGRDHTLPQRQPPPFPSVSVIVPPSAHLLRRPVRTVQDVNELVSTRHDSVIPKLLDALEHRNGEVAWAAEQGLRQFEEAGFCALVQTVLTCRGKKQERAVMALGRWGDMRATPALLRAVEREQQQRNEDGNAVALIGVLCMPFALFWFLSKSARSTLLRERVAEALGNMGDLRAVGWLAQTAFAGSAELSVAGQKALDKILPLFDSINQGQTPMLASDTVPGLAYLLSHPNLRLVRYALSALRLVGDGRAVSAVEQLATLRSPYPEAHRMASRSSIDRLLEERYALGEEAYQLLPLLRERARQAENHYTLLRGASAPSTAPEELLRPAQGYTGPEDKPDELLRPSSS